MTVHTLDSSLRSTKTPCGSTQCSKEFSLELTFNTSSAQESLHASEKNLDNLEPLVYLNCN